MTERIPMSENKKLSVVNFFGGPCTGKSASAAHLFYLMKREHYKVEMIYESAKEFVWEKWLQIFGEQDYIFAHQHRQQRRLVGHNIDYAILDSSMLLGMFYTPDDFPPSFKVFLRDVFDSYDNINIYLNRTEAIPYETTGRNQTLDEAVDIDKRVYNYLVDNNIEFHQLEAGDQVAQQVLKLIQART